MSDGIKVGIVAIVVLLAAILVLFGVKVQDVSAQSPQTTVLWTAPGDDGDVGRATRYELRFSRTTIGADTLVWWNQATIAPNMPIPSQAGSRDSVVVNLSTWNATYYFIIRTCDDGLPPRNPSTGPNCSGWSNVSVKFVGAQPDTIPPRRIIDLLAR